MGIIETGEKQKTISCEVTYKGIGLHTGNESRLVFKPAPENSGVVFIRTDLPSRPVLPASYKIVSSVVRGTTLSFGGTKDHEARVHTVEHVLGDND
jgi:UDP-3-O-acyl-N-acetylglucosamine deacetylase